MKPDRFDRMIARITGPAWCADSDIQKGEVVVLLRRQHAAYVRLVKRDLATERYQNECNETVKQATCEYLLAAFARYRKGTPGARR